MLTPLANLVRLANEITYLITQSHLTPRVGQFGPHVPCSRLNPFSSSPGSPVRPFPHWLLSPAPYPGYGNSATPIPRLSNALNCFSQFPGSARP